MKICMTARSPAKLGVLEKALRALGLNWEAEFLQHDIEAQIKGAEDIAAQATQLALMACRQTGADFGISIRSGVHQRGKIGHYYFGPTVVSVTKEGRVHVSLGQDIWVPKDPFEKVRTEMDLNRAMLECLGGSGLDIYEHFSGGKMEYDEILLMAVRTALLPLTPLGKQAD